MTVHQLIEKLKQMPQDAPVKILFITSKPFESWRGPVTEVNRESYFDGKPWVEIAGEPGQ